MILHLSLNANEAEHLSRLLPNQQFIMTQDGLRMEFYRLESGSIICNFGKHFSEGSISLEMDAYTHDRIIPANMAIPMKILNKAEHEDVFNEIRSSSYRNRLS